LYIKSGGIQNISPEKNKDLEKGLIWLIIIIILIALEKKK
jgi:hypothetical protein